MNDCFTSKPQQVFYGEPDSPQTEQPPQDRVFSQSEVDHLMKNYRKGLQSDLADARAKLAELEARPDLESALSQRDGEWQSRVHELEDGQSKAIADAVAAKEAELTAHMSERDAQHQTALGEITARHDEIEGRIQSLNSKYNRHLADSALIDAATGGGAFNPKIVVKLLSDRAAVVDGQVMVDVGTGEPVSPSEAIEFMKSQPDEYGSLFKSGVVGGLGLSSGSRLSAKQPNLGSLSPEQYRELKKSNPNVLGLRGNP